MVGDVGASMRRARFNGCIHRLWAGILGTQTLNGSCSNPCWSRLRRSEVLHIFNYKAE
jgi:hypothetical protein